VLAVAVLRRLLELEDAQLASELFRRRAESFLFQRVAGQRVTIELGGRRFAAGQSDRSGHFRAEFDLDEAFVADLAPVGPERCLSYTAVLGDTDDDGLPAPPAGAVHLVEATGTSVISDIDDTVKITNVADRRELLRNTLLREFAAVPGMPEAYRRWQETGAAFHYVSASPWQLSDSLNTFLGAAGLPAGSMHLKLFRLKDSTPLGRFPSRKRSKRRAIEQILGDFPGRRFLLVGDSGERDPEVYASIARRRPAQVAGILIRQVEAKASRSKVRTRLERLARRLPEGTMRVFTAADELADLPVP
jgi:phosphatidate phosphatase APP1